MNQSELIAAVAQRTGISEREVRAVIKATAAVIKEQLVAGEPVRIAALGTFTRSWRAERVLRDIQNSRKMYLDGRFVPWFRPAALLRRELKQLTDQHWRDPEHQSARRTALTLMGDLALYRTEVRISLRQLHDEAVHAACLEQFGEDWSHLLDTYSAHVSARVRSEFDHIAAAARMRFP